MQLADRHLLRIAIVGSLALHAGLLTIRWASPEPPSPTIQAHGLAVLLVNAADQRAPLHAEALAQVNLDGGGNADHGRRKSPLPDMSRQADGSLLAAQRERLAMLEERQAEMFALLVKHPAGRTAAHSDPVDFREKGASPMAEAVPWLARREAEIAREIDDYQKRPIKTQLTPSTRKVAMAMYYTALQQRIEQTGTRHFPEQAGKKMYGKLIVYIPVSEDGSLYEKEGGPRVERSSGNPALDQAALWIVRRAAPFGPLPVALRSDGKTHVWEIVTHFHFTREQLLESRSTGDPR